MVKRRVYAVLAAFTALALVMSIPALAADGSGDGNIVIEDSAEDENSDEADSEENSTDDSDEDIVIEEEEDTDKGSGSSDASARRGEQYDPSDTDEDDPDSTPLYAEGEITTAAQFRSKPSSGSSSYGTIPKGTTVLVTLITDSGWYKVTWNGKRGYVAESLVTLNAKEEYDGTVEIEDDEGVLISDANFRSSPDQGDNVITGLAKGTVVTILSETDSGWYEVRYGDRTGYIYHGLVDDGSRDSGGAVTTSGVNFRSTPDPDADNVIGSIPAGESLTITDVTYNNWYKVRYKGTSGYVYGGYVERQ